VPLQKFGVGLGGSYGLEPGSATPTFATVGRQTFYSYASGVSEDGQHVRIDPQAYYFWGPFGLYGEYVASDEKYKIAGKTPSAANLNNTAWDIVGSYFLTGEDNNWAVLPDVDHPLRLNGSGWGAFQLAARFGQISLDPASFPIYAAKGSAQGATSWSISLNWYLNRNVKCIFEYSNTTFDGGSKTPGTVTGQTEQALLGRLQFGF
jgi:phosphate-selective porin OprO/OprP